ncbi:MULTISPECIES: response regulator transcription factor [Stappiaceae]|jgi:FixJ family two-component response regulator|uniref:Transcriptional regulatory protein FixJ n=2 Tax=Roseibium TaxID=150830 RepID=A0A0M6Y3R5_9HYPH|nr:MULTISPECIES: response regulator transcription factor [Stappiaceae]MCR9283599.1 response regulator transcription factor [Paracoccaceae bacterium]MEC9420676.1 response regulator transcription factor [Pseudomonadota bacterium]AQQ03780.1 DNA-binding response regulator [Roseibium aggregatum]ERP97282.1 hypothetical protein Q669_25200 [Labrenzia sp. C1B10]ERS09037.1 hypothetical protein Q675_16655 [Labrenzia sp. C1B70]
MTDNPIVHIIDDDTSLREALVRLFRSVGLEARPYVSVAAFLEAGNNDTPGCLLLDVRLPGMSGLDFQRQLEDLGIRMPAIMMTGHGDIPMSVSAMKAGAVDFLPKPFRDQDLLDAVAIAIERDSRNRTDNREKDQLQALYESLTRRERQVMTRVCAGRLNKQVAADLDLSEITVKIHRGTMMKKMRARTLADLVRMAQILGLKDPHVDASGLARLDSHDL